MPKRKAPPADGAAAAAQQDEAPEQQQEQQQAQESDSGRSSAEGGASSDGESDTSSSGDASSSGGGSDSGPDVSDAEAPDGDDEDAFDQINVDFQFFDPKDADFHGLKALLHSYLDGEQYDGSALVDAIIAQPTVGTVVRTGEDEDPIGVMTVLNTQQHSSASSVAASSSSGGGGFMAQVKAHMLAKCSDAALRAKFSQAWDAAGTGLVINERLINCPPQLAPPLVQGLFDEIAWATEDEPSQARRDAFKFQRYLLMTRVYSDPQAAAAAAAAAGGASSSSQQQQQQQQQQQPKKKKHKAGQMAPPPPRAAAAAGSGAQQPQQQAQQQAQQQQPVIVYVRPEDEFFHRHATAAFTFPVEGRAVGKGELQPLRLALLLPAAKVPAARQALDAVIGNAAA